MNWPMLFDPSHSGRLCLTLLHSIWQVALLALVVWAFGHLWRRKSVEWDYAFHVAVLVIAIVALPVTYANVRSARLADSASVNSPAPPVGSRINGQAPLAPVSDHELRAAISRPQATGSLALDASIASK